jgi:hypothetical protein
MEKMRRSIDLETSLNTKSKKNILENRAKSGASLKMIFTSQFSCLKEMAFGYLLATCLYFGSKPLHARHHGALATAAAEGNRKSREQAYCSAVC